MQADASDISHVSDTALMVAASRAIETARPDGMIHDPYAELLAGERGMAILRGLERWEMLTFGVGIRTRFLDELLLESIALDGIDTVLLLGAGLDSRPWRLDLPRDLRWIEVDFQDMLDYKASRLADAPRCRLERIAADLNEPAARAAVFSHAGERTVLITEGLLMYLPGDTIEGIAAEASRASVRSWLMDLNSTVFSERIGMNAFQSIQKVRSAESLNGEKIHDLLHRHGWTTLRWRNYTTDIIAAVPGRIQQMMQKRAAAGLPPPEPPPPNDFTGVHLFARQSK